MASAMIQHFFEERSGWFNLLVWARYKPSDCRMAHALAACCCCQAINRSFAIERSC